MAATGAGLGAVVAAGAGLVAAAGAGLGSEASDPGTLEPELLTKREPTDLVGSEPGASPAAEVAPLLIGALVRPMPRRSALRRARSA